MRLKLCVTNDEHTGARFQMLALADLVGEPEGLLFPYRDD